jgi:ribonucleotide reductase alpha subunit
LAGRIVVSNHQKNTKNSFYSVMTDLYQYTDKHDKQSPLISGELMTNVYRFSNELEEMIDYDRDYNIEYFGFKTLERAYLIKIDKKSVERPQHMWMRVSMGIHGDNLEKIKETYDLMSNKYFTHATPTLFNAGTPHPQLSSCYLLAMEDDSISGIYNTLKDCALISKWAGGIGIHIHNVRAAGSHIRGTNGSSNGIVPMLKVFNNTAKYVDQGGGKRNGSFAIYLEPWHADIEIFLQMRKNHGDEELKARDLFYALWIPDLFMKRMKSDENWTLMCPDECPGLADVYGEDFVTLYEKYEKEGKGRKTMKARDLWFQVLDAQMETGTPYLVYKDAANNKSNQKNIGTIKSSNLCSEIIEYSDHNESAVCNLASIAVPAFVEEKDGEIVYNYDKLHNVAKVVTNNLNNIIDINFYPTEKTKRSNMRHRPIGIGIQGLADVFIKMNISFGSQQSIEINKRIFETIYHAALEQSNEIAIERYHKIQNTDDNSVHKLFNEFENNLREGLLDMNTTIGSYSTFMGSPASQGILQFDMWNVTPSDRYDWNGLKESIKTYGIRNSLLLAPMPTASTSQILGYNECIEPITSNIYNRRTIAGEFILANKYLMKDLMDLNLWNEKIKNHIIANNGSIQNMEVIPIEIREKYKTVWEIPMKTLIDMAADRGAYICQSQSLNLWIEEPNYSTLTSMHFYSWSKGLKTGIYYLRRRARHQAQQFTIEPEKVQKNDLEDVEDEICEMCSA